MAGIDAILGVFNLKSHVIIAGGLKLIVWRPVSIYRVTSILPSFGSTFDANVAWGQSSIPAKSWPVWLQSSSTATFYILYIAFQVKLGQSFLFQWNASKFVLQLKVAVQYHVLTWY